MSSEMISPGDLVARALTWLEQNPDAPVAKKAAAGVLIACGGVDKPRPMTFGEIGEIVGESGADVRAGLESLYDANEPRGESLAKQEGTP
jgi:hypothetical protein